MFRSFDLSGTANDLTATFSYSPSSQIASTTRTGDAYAYTAMGNGSTAYTSNGLNQQVSIGGSTATWDSNGNLATEPQSGKTYTYNVQNQLTGSTGGTATSLAYDPLDRLDTYNPGALRRFVYDGVEAAAELDSSGAIQDRYVRGDGADELLVDYSGSGTTSRRFTSADERGSVISLTDSSGNLVGIDRYDEYGKPQPTNIGRFQYTGQAWLAEANVDYYKARTYLPHLGIFGETDPLGPQDDANLYAYVLNDPVNLVDPTGLATQLPPDICTVEPEVCINIFGTPPQDLSASFTIGGTSGGRSPCDPATFDPNTCPIYIHGKRFPKRALPPLPPPVKVYGPWRYGNYCGQGGAGQPIDRLDLACKAHDQCYGALGFDVHNDYYVSSNDPALQQCNQQLCNAVRPLEGSAFSRFYDARNNAAWEIDYFFSGRRFSRVRTAVACH
jgi:RHS repeat-associated protein